MMKTKPVFRPAIHCFWVGLILLFGTIAIPQATAQIGLLTGYGVSRNEVTTPINRLVADFNATIPTNRMKMPMGNFLNLHNLQVGLRYRMESVDIEANWVFRFQVHRNRRLDDANAEVQDAIYYAHHSGSLGLLVRLTEQISVGGSVMLNVLRLRREQSNDRSKTAQLIEENWLGEELFFNFELSINDFLSVMLRPYIEFPNSQRIDFSAAARSLNPAANTDLPAAYQAAPLAFGLRLIFCNGEQ